MKRLIVLKKEATESTSSSYDSYDSYDSSYENSTSLQYDTSTDPVTETVTETETETETETDTDSEPETETETETETDGNIKTIKTSKQKNKNGFKTIASLNYKKDETKTMQSKMSKQDILNKLEGFISLNNIEEMSVLETLPIMKTWVRYMNKETKQFRLGGLLLKVEYPKYIVLANTTHKIVWSVQLNNNVLFIKDRAELEKSKKIKDKLFDLYNSGRLILKK